MYELCDRVRDEPVELPGIHYACGDERGDALHGGEEEEADALRLARLEQAGLLALLDQLKDRGEGAVGRGVQRAGLFAVLAGEHEL